MPEDKVYGVPFLSYIREKLRILEHYKAVFAVSATVNASQLSLLLLLSSGEMTGLKLSEVLGALTGRRYSIGWLMRNMYILESKGYIQSRLGEATPQRGGNRARIYSVTDLWNKQRTSHDKR